MKTTALVALGIAVLALVLIVSVRSGSEPPKPLSEKTNREVALTCTTDMATEFHIHPTLEIIVNGEPQTIPANIGVRPSCMNSIHTHTADGLLHVEAPEKRDFTLADFFAVWDKPFSKNQVLEYVSGDSHAVHVTVDGKEVYTFEDTVLKEKEKIIITYEPI